METMTTTSGRKQFIWKHLLTILFALAAIGLFFWGWFSMRSMKAQFQEDQTLLIDSFEARIDTVQLEGMELTSKVLSWAVRSEVSRQNNEQVNQFFLQFIQEANVSKAQYVDAETGIILLSTDKKDEGTSLLNTLLLTSGKQVVEQDSLRWRIATPVMGLNQKLGVLIVESPRNVQSE